MEHVSSITLKLPRAHEAAEITSPGSECQNCRGTGFVSVEGKGVRRCECQRDRTVAQKLAQIPKRFTGARFENFDPKDGSSFRARREFEGNPTGSFYVFGGYGRGKTHLAIAQYRHMVEIERPCMFMSIAELIGELRRAGMDSDYFCQVRHRVRYAESFHLFVDDIDKFKSTDFKFETLFDLFDTIYRRSLGITITSNLSLVELQQERVLDNSIVRRIDDICKAVEL